MNLVLSGPIDSSLIETIERLSQSTSVTPARHSAWRFADADDSPPIRRTVATLCNAAAVDHAYVKANLRFSDMKLLALDMDSTLINIECIDELADFAGKRDEVAAITDATMRGEITDFADSLKRRVALLEGLDVSILERVYVERLRLSPGAETLIDAARANGIYLLLVSGGFTYFADRLRDLLGFDAAFANHLGTKAGKLTGRIDGAIVDAAFKARTVRDTMKQLQRGCAEAIVVGDGANDIPMMECVENSIAYRAKPLVNHSARMIIQYGGLDTAINYFM